MPTTLRTYAKFWTALVGALLTTAVSLDWGFDLPQWVAALSSLLTAAAVYLVKNEPYVQLEGDAEDQMFP